METFLITQPCKECCCEFFLDEMDLCDQFYCLNYVCFQCVGTNARDGIPMGEFFCKKCRSEYDVCSICNFYYVDPKGGRLCATCNA